MKRTSTLRWHIESNFSPAYNQSTINGMIKTVNSFLNGRKNLSDSLVKGTSVTVADLLEDLHLPLNRKELFSTIYKKVTIPN